MKKLIILLALVAVAFPVAAQSPVRFMASEEISYDDNIYLTDKDTKDSFISTTRVGADYKTLIPGSGVELSANGVVGYNAYTEKASKNNYWDTLAGVQLKNDLWTIGDRFLFTSDPANNELTERAKRINNTAYASFKTSAEKLFSFGLTVDDSNDHYMKNTYEDLNRNRFNGGAQVYYNFSPKTNLFVEYVYTNIAYKSNKLNNSSGNTFGLGVNGQLAPKVTGTAKVTYAMRDYNHDKVVGGVTADNHPDLLGYYVAAEWKPSTQNTVRLSGERRMEETFYGANRYFADTVVSLYGSQKIMEKWTASLTLSYENMNYARYAGDTKRSDDLYTVRPAVDYQFKDWLTAGVWYQFRSRQSNTNPFDYDSNKAGIYVKGLF